MNLRRVGEAEAIVIPSCARRSVTALLEFIGEYDRPDRIPDPFILSVILPEKSATFRDHALGPVCLRSKREAVAPREERR
jgi:hypothetical protein